MNKKIGNKMFPIHITEDDQIVKMLHVSVRIYKLNGKRISKESFDFKTSFVNSVLELDNRVRKIVLDSHLPKGRYYYSYSVYLEYNYDKVIYSYKPILKEVMVKEKKIGSKEEKGMKRVYHNADTIEIF